jgi:hypothetical protein
LKLLSKKGVKDVKDDLLEFYYMVECDLGVGVWSVLPLEEDPSYPSLPSEAAKSATWFKRCLTQRIPSNGAPVAMDLAEAVFQIGTDSGQSGPDPAMAEIGTPHLPRHFRPRTRI